MTLFNTSFTFVQGSVEDTLDLSSTARTTGRFAWIELAGRWLFGRKNVGKNGTVISDGNVFLRLGDLVVGINGRSRVYHQR